MAADFDSIEAAFYAWLSLATGLPVIWADQPNVAQPSGDYCSLQWADVDRRVGAFDAVYAKLRPGLPAGEEFALTVCAEREAAVLVQAYTAATVGSACAWQRLRQARLQLALPSAAYALELAGVVIVDQGELQAVPAIVEADFEGRAACRIRIRYRDSVSETETFIETVNATGAVE